MRWVRILLVIGSIVGGLLLLFGLLALLAGVTDTTSSPSDRSDEILGSVVFMVIGVSVLAPCLGVLIFVRPSRSLPQWQQPLLVAVPPGSVGVSGPPYAMASPDLESSYLQWFGWCQREVGGDSIALHAATMAALGRAVIGDSGGALAAARDAARSASPGMSQPPKPIRSGKIKLLAKLGSGTLPLLEPGETVVVSIRGTDRHAQNWHLAFGLIGFLVSASQSGAYYITVTDRRVIVLVGPMLATGPQSFGFVVPRSMIVEAKQSQGLFRDRLSFSRVTGEKTRIQSPRLWRPEGQRMAEVLAPGQVPTPMPATPMIG